MCPPSRELLRCEALLTSFYCRSSLMALRKEVTSSVQPTLEHLKTVSAECFAEPLPEGASTTTSPELTPSPSSCLQTLTLSPLPVFYSDPQRVCQEVALAIRTLPDQLEPLAQAICTCLQTAPHDFGYTELKVLETKEAMDVTYPDAAFLVISVVEETGETIPPPR